MKLQVLIAISSVGLPSSNVHALSSTSPIFLPWSGLDLSPPLFPWLSRRPPCPSPLRLSAPSRTAWVSQPPYYHCFEFEIRLVGAMLLRALINGPRCASERSRDLLDFASVSPPPSRSHSWLEQPALVGTNDPTEVAHADSGCEEDLCELHQLVEVFAPRSPCLVDLQGPRWSYQSPILELLTSQSCASALSQDFHFEISLPPSSPGRR